MDDVDAIAPARGDAVQNFVVALDLLEQPESAELQHDDEDQGGDVGEVAGLLVSGLARLQRPADRLGRRLVGLRHDRLRAGVGRFRMGAKVRLLQ